MFLRIRRTVVSFSWEEREVEGVLGFSGKRGDSNTRVQENRGM